MSDTEEPLDSDDLCKGVLSLSDARALIRHLVERINRKEALLATIQRIVDHDLDSYNPALSRIERLLNGQV